MKETASGRKAIESETSSVPDLGKKPDGQYNDHWVLSKEEREKGFIRPVRESYVHLKCGTSTRMPIACAETYARDPHFYGSTFCCHCGTYPPVGEDGEFVWDTIKNEKVGT